MHDLYDHLNFVAALNTGALAGSRVKCHTAHAEEVQQNFAMFLPLIWLRFFPILRCADF